MPSSLDFIALEQQYGARNYAPLDVVLARGEGVWVYDVEGRRYLDCLSAYSVVNQGHCHPRILRAMNTLSQRLTMTARAFHNDQLGLFCKEISDLTGYSVTQPMDSGAEAVETAIKIARNPQRAQHAVASRQWRQP